MLSISVVICTKDRPQDLARCLVSLAKQSHPPNEIVVVDASTLPSPWDNDLAHNQLPPLRYIPSPPGLPHQRNLALRYVKSDIIAFFDDDVELAPDYVAQLLTVYERHWGEHIGGVMGCDPNWRQSSGGAYWLKRFFHLTHVRPTGSRVRVFRTMGVSWVAEPPHEIPVEAMPGFCMSYRQEALAEADIWFDEALGGYADGEDVDVSVRVGRRYPLWQTPKARLVHHRSRAGRATLHRRFFTRTRNEHYLQRKLFPPTLRTRPAWWWGAVGRVLVAALVGLRQGSVAPLRGTIAGLFASPPAES